MRLKRNLIFILIFLVSVSVSYSALTCYISNINTECATGEVNLLTTYSSTGGHVTTPTSTSKYNYKLCCGGIDGLTNSCTSSKKVTLFKLAKDTNSHILSKTSSTGTEICLSSTIQMSCVIGPSECGTKSCVASLYKTTDSHLAKCGSEPGLINVCCGQSSTSFVCGDTHCNSGEECASDCNYVEYWCGDNVDNDQDSCIDCNDVNCQESSGCSSVANAGTETECDDTFDNDCDGDIDCDDSDCLSVCPSIYVTCGNGVCEANEVCPTDCKPKPVGEGEKYCSDNVDNDGDGCKNLQDSDCEGTESICDDLGPLSDNDCDGLINCQDPDCFASVTCATACNVDIKTTVPQGACDIEHDCSSVVDSATDQQAYGGNRKYICVGCKCQTYQCSDNIDNDGDTKKDYPNDPGCGTLADIDETDPPARPECSDTIDNDADGKIDYGTATTNDPDCLNAADNSESLSEVPLAGLVGCRYSNNKFIQAGTRANIQGINKYCDGSDNQWKTQNANGATCQNDYECVSNTCKGKCINVEEVIQNIGLIKKIWCALLHPTLGTEYETCLVS